MSASLKTTKKELTLLL